MTLRRSKVLIRQTSNKESDDVIDNDLKCEALTEENASVIADSKEELEED